MFCAFTVQHVGLGVGETESAGLQQVRGSDGRSGDGHSTQTQHLELEQEKKRCDTWRGGGGGDGGRCREERINQREERRVGEDERREEI